MTIPNRPRKPPADACANASAATEKAVRSGYDAVAQNILQARVAAERFRQGAYNINDIPGDLAQVSRRMPHVINNFSTAGIEILQSLITATGSSRAAGFLSVELDAGNAPKDRVCSLTEILARPANNVRPNDIFCGPLKPGQGNSVEIAAPKFTFDLTTGALVAVIKPDLETLKADVYSGIVYAKGQKAPLGVLSVEIKDLQGDGAKDNS